MPRLYVGAGLFLRISEPNAPRIETAAERTKAYVKVPVASLIKPPIQGPSAWPMPKKSVMKPSPAGASLPPTASPAAAAIIVGIEKAAMPKTKAEA